MSGRLPTHLAVGALLRRTNDAGGMAMVRAKGDAQAGGVLVLIEDAPARALERGVGSGGAPALIESRRGDEDDPGLEDYWRTRRRRDPDLWVVAISPAAEPFVADALLA